MFGKFSVRKPFTVLVGVMLIIVLGLVSFMSTTTDLLPSMNLPYAVVMTTYPGMTPEQVEADITVPIEGRMGTVSGIDGIMSISNEHFSVVILEFTGSTNMDSAVLEMRELLDRIDLPDNSGKPTILKINPNMLPVMVSAVYWEGRTVHEVSALVSDEIAPALEGVPGIASVSTSGMIHHQLNVLLRHEKVEAVNQRLAAAVQALIDGAMAEMQRQAAEAVEAQVTEYAQARTAELMAQGLSLEEASLQVQMELPAVTEQVTQAVTEAMTEGMAGQEPPQSVGIPEQMLTVETITGFLQAQNFSMPAGMMTEDNVEYMIRVGDRFTTADAVASMLLFDPGLEGFDPVTLSDIADVFPSDNSDSEYTRVNGSPAVMLTMQKQSEFATSDVTHSVLTQMETLKEAYDGLAFAVLMDQGEYIDIIIDSVVSNLLWGALLAVVILLLFLRDLRPTLIVSISIPVSLLLAFAAMYFSGITLNIISISGLALAVGMLVDNSIVVIENIYRLRGQGVPVRRAAIEGTKQVAGAIAASTFTTIAVFLPIVFTEGLTRQLFTDLALTLSYALLASLLVAMTVVPAAASGLFRKREPREQKLYDRFRDWYGRLLRSSLGVGWLVLLIAAAAFGLSSWGIFSKGSDFMPAMNSPQLTATVSVPEGASFEEAVAAAEIVGSRIGEIEDVETVGATIGGSGMLAMMGSLMGGGSQGTSVSMYVLLHESHTLSNEQVAQQIRDRTADLDCEVTVSGNGGMGNMAMITGGGVEFSIRGRELDDLRDTAIEVAAIIRSVEGTADVTDVARRAAPEWRIRVDKDGAMRRGLSVAQVYMAVSKALTEPEQTVSMSFSGVGYEVIVKDGGWKEPDLNSLRTLLLTGSTGESVTLSEIAEIYEDTGFTSINRRDGSRYVTVGGEIADGYNVGLVNAEIERRLADYTPREGCTVSVGGQVQAIADAFGDLYLMLALALVFIYLIMVAQFQSLLSPFIVMFTIPLAFTGGFAALLIADMPLSVVGMIGLILLSGIVINNGIVFIDCVNQLRREGVAKKDALVEAGRIRLRPILMTALTTIAAMSMMIFAVGRGSEMVQPMAIATVGGLVYATLMTLFVVPVMYNMFHRNRDMSKDEDVDYDPDAGN